ncbi:MAG: CueP family metal-binding protein [Propionibacteriaceae bacterium]|nr:CueP family metal-binding protein [Propionibacteriaceae bacterium]
MFAASAAALILLAGCSAPATTHPAPPAAGQSGDVLATVGLAGKTGQQIVDELDQSPDARPLPLRASVRYDHVVIGDGTNETQVPIEGDQFYLSIAPFATQTHECFYHSLATCMGELQETDLHVRIVDSTGTVLVDEDTTTYANGFVGFWLPQDISGEVTVTADGKTGTVPFATGPDDATCLTTLQIS